MSAHPDDSLEEFLGDFGVIDPPAAATMSLPVLETDDLPDPPKEPTPLLRAEDPEEAYQALRAKFPDGQEGLLREAAESQRIVEAMLVEKTDKRVDVLLARFLRQGGTITSDERAEIKGHGAEWARCRDLGFTIDQEPNKAAGGNIFTLRLDIFGTEVRNQRDFLTSGERRRLFLIYDHKCNRCGADQDLQADHRCPVNVAGGADHQLEAYQTLCRTCNNNKRTACNRCTLREPSQCQNCSWAYPESGMHTAGVPGERADFLLRPGARQEAREILLAHGLLVDGVGV